MRLLVNGTTRLVAESPDSQYLGHLLSPRCGMAIEFAAGTRLPLGADNGCFNRFEPEAFLRMLDRITGFPRLVFVCLPDVVADARATMDLFDDWKLEVAGRGLPVALVAQDGLETMGVPWDELDAIFIGGSTAWKLGYHAASLAAKAKTLGKYVHMGRVNSFKRFRHAYRIGCTSVDGSQFSWFPNTHIPRAVEWLESLHRHPPTAPVFRQTSFWK